MDKMIESKLQPAAPTGATRLIPGVNAGVFFPKSSPKPMKRSELLALLPDHLKKRAPKKRSEYGPVSFEYRGFKVQVIGYFGNYIGFIDRPGEAPFRVTGFDGVPFIRRKRARGTCRTVIKWHWQFGGWVLPKRRPDTISNPRHSDQTRARAGHHEVEP